jgi:hypothetical protein
MFLETSVSFMHLTRLIAREDFIESCRREIFRSYKDQLVKAIYGNNRCLLRELNKTHKYTQWTKYRVTIIKWGGTDTHHCVLKY